MPLISLSGPQALATRKANAVAGWGDRNQDNRVEPIAKPAFDVPFAFQPGEAIFTIGSCFARNIEEELKKRGFEIPMRDLFRTKAFEGLDAEIVNNFGTPSIYNELAWAFGEQAFDYDRGFYEVKPGKFVDLQMVPSVRPAPLETVRARRDGLLAATRQMAECRVVVMTLGLVELWWDEEAGVYLNSSPLPSILHGSPERFSLHVLDFEECHRYLRSAFDVMFRHGRDDLQVILTVSPVPMMTTHRRCDVISANTYSKSVLRAVAEHLVEAHERITYFPSYETVTLSNRRAAWRDDLIHVERPMVAFNVERLIAAFTGSAREEIALPDILPDSEQDEGAEAILLSEQARHARIRKDRRFFEDHEDAAGNSPLFALEYARFLFEERRFERALDAIDGDTGIEAQWLRADIQMALENYDEVLRIAQAIRDAGVRGAVLWKLMIGVHVARGDKKALLATEKDWATREPRAAIMRNLHIARALRRIGAATDALPRLAEIIDEPQMQPSTTFEYARALIATDAPGEALAMLEKTSPNTQVQLRNKRQLEKAARRKMQELEARKPG